MIRLGCHPPRDMPVSYVHSRTHPTYSHNPAKQGAPPAPLSGRRSVDRSVWGWFSGTIPVIFYQGHSNVSKQLPPISPKLNLYPRKMGEPRANTVACSIVGVVNGGELRTVPNHD